MQTVCHPTRDLMAVRVESPLLANGQARVRIAFPYALGQWMKAADWNSPHRHETRMTGRSRRVDFERIMDDTRYHVALEHSAGFSAVKTGAHDFILSPTGVRHERLQFGIEGA